MSKSMAKCSTSIARKDRSYIRKEGVFVVCATSVAACVLYDMCIETYTCMSELYITCVCINRHVGVCIVLHMLYICINLLIY